MLKKNFIKTMENSIRNNWHLPALSDYKGETAEYRDVARQISRLHAFFKQIGLKPGDKISLLGKNSKNWGITYFAVVGYGAVIVPILPDFHADDVQHIVNHSDSLLLFCAEALYDNLNPQKMDKLKGAVKLEDFSLLDCCKKQLRQSWEKSQQKWETKTAALISPETFQLADVGNEQVLSLVYTSGTTGFSKGVMLPANSLMANVKFAQENLPLKAGHKVVSFLPVAHCYGCAFEFLYPFSIGAHITFLGKIPSPRIIMQAFADVKPDLILSVPLIIEKIYRKQIKSVIDKPHMKLLLKTPVINKMIAAKIREKLTQAFGGNFYQIIIGGAALNSEVESFLKKIGFRFTVGYGMTECGPLISYEHWKTHRAGSTGKTIKYAEVKIDSPEPDKIPGEVLVKGEVVMYGYYKNKKDSAEALDRDGWLHTGDLGVMDEDGHLYLKGRSKTMLLGPSGQNIFPEEIESRLNNLPYVEESLVVMKENKLVALVYPNMEQIDDENLTENQLLEKLEKTRKQLNEQLPAYSQVTKIELYPQEFEKTPKKSIKRFLYTGSQ